MEELEKLLLNGFVIYSSNGKFAFRKTAVSSNPIVIEEVLCDSYLDSVKKATELLETPQLLNWEAIIRYNRGLGIEYRNIFDIFALNLDAAKEIAAEMAFNILDKNVEVLEIKVKLKQ